MNGCDVVSLSEGSILTRSGRKLFFHPADLAAVWAICPSASHVRLGLRPGLLLRAPAPLGLQTAPPPPAHTTLPILPTGLADKSLKHNLTKYLDEGRFIYLS